MNANQTPNPGTSPLPNAVRSVYYDDRGEPYYTEWQLLPEAPTATGEATVTRVTEREEADTRKAA